VGYLQGEWWWIAITTAGALLANLVWQLPGAPSWHECYGSYSQLTVMKGNITDKPYFILHSFIALACGASAGPGMSLGAFGCSMGELVNNYLDERDQKLIMLCGFASVFAPALPTPYIGVLLAIEMLIVAQSGDSSLTRYDASSARQLTNPVLSGRFLHDHMEKVCTIGISVTGGFLLFRSIIKYEIDKEEDEDLANEADVKPHHMFSAVLLGTMCGFMVSFFMQFRNVLTRIRINTESKLFYDESNNRVPRMLEPFLFPILGGIFYGLIIVSFPLVAGGLSTSREIITMSYNRTLDNALLNGYDEDDDEHITAGTLLLGCFFKLIGTAMNLGWCWLGGLFFPLSTAGTFMGAALDILAPDVFPATMAIPCCIVALTSSFVPILLTLMALVCFVNGDAIVVNCALISGITGYTMVAGGGLLQKFGYKSIKDVMEKYDCEPGDDLFAMKNDSTAASKRNEV